MCCPTSMRILFGHSGASCIIRSAAQASVLMQHTCHLLCRIRRIAMMATLQASLQSA